MDESLLGADQMDGTSDNPLSCDQCPSSFSSLSELENHLETHKEERPYICSQCGRSYRHAGSLVNHKKTHQIGLFACLICQKEYSNPMGLKNHLRTHSEEKRFKCDECGESFRMSRQLSSHKKASHGLYSTFNEEDIPNGQDSLDTTGPVLIENSSLLRNLENYIAESMVPGDFPQLVSKAPVDFAVKQEVVKLETSSEEQEDQLTDSTYEVRRYKCNQCGKAYKHAGSLANHRQSHTIGVYQCAICYKEFSNLMAMKNHCRLHSDSRSQRRSKTSCSNTTLVNYPSEDNADIPQHSYFENFMEKPDDHQRLSDVSENSTSEEETTKTPNTLQNFMAIESVSSMPSAKTIKSESNIVMESDPPLQISNTGTIVQEEQDTSNCKSSSRAMDEVVQSQTEQQGSEITDEEDSKPGENLEHRPFKCQECGRTYRHAGSLINHKKTHQTGVYSCSICSKQLFNVAALKNHLRAHFKSRAGRKLEDTYFIPSDFSHELFQGADDTYQCNICSEILTCESDFLQHQALHQDEGILETCNDDQHIEEVPTLDNDWGENPQVSQGSSEDSAYSSGPGVPDAIKREVENLALQQPLHQWGQEETPAVLPETSTKEEPSLQNSLPSCEQSANDDPIVSKETDSSELEEQDQPTDIRPYKCEACGRTYRHKSSLLNHKLTHQTGIYQCSLCPKQYSNLMALRNHIRFHSRSHTSKRGRQIPHNKPNALKNTCFENRVNDVSYITSMHDAHTDFTEETCPEPHICSCCGEFFDSVESLESHCQLCKKLAPSTEDTSTDLKVGNSMRIDSEDRICKTEEATEPQAREQGRKVYECDLCEKSYRHSGSLINHKRTHQTGDFVCSVCSKHVHNLAALKNHLRIHHKVRKEKRGERYDSSGFLYHDMSFSHDNNGLYGCASCEEIFQSEEELVTHQEVHMELEGGSWEQQMEDGSATGVDDLEFRTYSGAELDNKESAFNSNEEYNNLEHSSSSEDLQHKDGDDHGMNSSGEEIKPVAYKCEECGEVFSSPDYLNNHQHTHQTGIYQCSFCPKEYPNLLSLRNHFQSHTKPQTIRSSNKETLDGSEDIELSDDHTSNDNSYDCGHCGMVFSNEADFHQHQVAHENQAIQESPLDMHNEGEVSEFPFPMHSSEQELLRRIKKEMEEGDTNEASDGGSHLSHICGFCGKTYDDLESLKTHSLSHSEEMPLVDETSVQPEENFENNNSELQEGLKEEFDSAENLKIEEAQESRPYTCDQCGKTYRHGGSLVNHKKTHLVGNFQCVACSRQYPNLAAYRNHLRHHPKCKQQAALHNMHEFSVPNPHESIYPSGNGELLNHSSTANVALQDQYASEILYSDSKPCVDIISKDNTSLKENSSPQRSTNARTKRNKPLNRRPAGAKSARKAGRRFISLTNQGFGDAGQGRSLSDSQNVAEADDKCFQICEFCGKSFFNVNELIIHLSGNCHGSNMENYVADRIITDEEMEQPLTGSLQAKEEVEIGFHQRPYRCEVCGRSYRHAGSLINHKQTHKTGVFRCAICQKRFFNLMAMKNHNRIHFELKRHKCLECGKAFRLRKQLDTHQRIHIERAASKKHGRRNRRVAKSRKITLLQQQKSPPLQSPNTNSCNDSVKQEDSVIDPSVTNDASIPGIIKQELNPDSRPYQCDQCGRSYRHAGSLVNHKKSHTTGQYCCTICDKTYPNLMAMKNHQRTHYEAKRHICSECGKAFKWQRQLIRHKLVHAKEMSKTQLDLGKEEAGEKVLDQERSIITGRKLKSRKRSKNSGRKLLGNALEVTPINPSPSSPLKPICQDCGILFISYDELENHTCRESNAGSTQWQSLMDNKQIKGDGDIDPLQLQQTEERPYQCNQCDRTYRHAGSLLNHKNTHKTGLFKCSICLKQFFNPVAIKNHLRTHNAEKRFQCKECGKAFRSSRELICHHRVHTGERPFHCTICRRGFSSKLTLRHHQRTHKDLPSFSALPSLSPTLDPPKDEGTKNSEDHPSLSNEQVPTQDPQDSQEERRFKCNQCDRSYRHAGSLLNHKKTHSTGVYQCSDCHKEFFNLLALKNHLRIHRYPCPDCGKAFRIASHLATHRKIHEQGGPFTCSVCSKRFFTRSSFERHQLTHSNQGNDVPDSQYVNNFMVEVT
ncbi:zinc finger protein 646 [Discoglossus pictus]